MDKKRNPVFALQISLANAKDFLLKLRELNQKIEEIQGDDELLLKQDPDIWTETVLFRKAVWIALIVEIGRLFDTFEKENKKVISFKSIFKGSSLASAIDSIHGEAIIGKILATRNTFTAHIGENQGSILSATEICNSNLGDLLNKLDAPLASFNLLFIDNRGWEKL